jgi:hypothetical protein
LLSSAVSVPGTFACLIMPPCIEIPGETFWSRKMNWNDWNGIFFPALPYLISNKIKEESCDGQKSKLHPYNKHSVTYKWYPQLFLRQLVYIRFCHLNPALPDQITAWAVRI